MKLAVLGDPLAYTLSPVLHRAGLEALGIPAESAAIRTTPAEIAARLEELRAAGFRGTNVTAPLKAAVLPHLTRVTVDAARFASVNTIGWDGEEAWGASTDGAGLLAALAREDIDPAGASIVILGAGGAARSVAGALATVAGSVHIATRDPARHRDTLVSAGLPEPLALDSAAFDAALDGARLVIRAVPGMVRGGALEAARMPARAACVDLAYGPEMTPWVQAVRARGGRAMDGLGMLIHQARASLALWTGREVPLAPLEAAVGWPR